MDDGELPRRLAHQAPRRARRGALRRRQAVGERTLAADPDAHAGLGDGALRLARATVRRVAQRRLVRGRRRHGLTAYPAVQARHGQPALPLLPGVDHEAPAGRGSRRDHPGHAQRAAIAVGA